MTSAQFCKIKEEEDDERKYEMEIIVKFRYYTSGEKEGGRVRMD